MLGDISDKTRHSIDKQILFNDVVVANLPSISRLPTGDLGIVSRMMEVVKKISFIQVVSRS